MNEPNANTTGRPRGLVAVVLFAAFLACLGWAGLVVYQRTIRPRSTGQKILSALAKEGLDRSLPPATGGVEWYIETDPRGLVQRYEAYHHTRGPDGHRIANLVYYPNSPIMSLQSWTIANDLSTSEYRASEGLPLGEYGSFPGLPDMVSLFDAPGLTFIDQAEGEVTVQRRLAAASGQAEIVTAPAPGNLIPEGALSATLRYVAQRQVSGTFCMITNSRAIVSGRLAFTVVHIRPVGKNRIEVTDEVPGMVGESRMVWILDAAGGIAGWERPGEGTHAERVTRTQLLTRLRDLDAIRAAERTLRALTAEKAPVKPTTTSRPTTFPATRLAPIARPACPPTDPADPAD